MTPDALRVPCVGAVVRDDSGRLLLIRRRNDPGRGRWSIPGGRVESGETDEEALVREVVEETGLAVTVGALVGTVERDGPDGCVYVIRDYLGTTSGAAAPVAGDDADAVAWVAESDLASYELVDGLLAALEEWRLLG